MVHEFDSKTYDLMKQALHDIEYMKDLCVKKESCQTGSCFA